MSLAILKTLFAQKTWAKPSFVRCHALSGRGAACRARCTWPCRTLNHIYVVDRIFRAHLLGEAHGYTQTNTDDTPALGDLHLPLPRRTTGLRTSYVAALSESALVESLNFQFTDGDAGRMTREEMLFHVLAHGSYHRGNVAWQALLKGIGMAPPRDLLTKFLHQREPARRQPA